MNNDEGEASARPMTMQEGDIDFFSGVKESPVNRCENLVPPSPSLVQGDDSKSSGSVSGGQAASKKS